MLTTRLLQNLLTIEQMLGQRDPLPAHTLMLEAQAHLLAIEREHLDLLEEVACLRNLGRAALPSELCRICPLCRTGLTGLRLPAEA